MPFKRKRAPARAARRVRRKMTRRIPRYVRSAQQQLLMKRTFFDSTWVFGTVSTGEFWRYNTFTISQLPNIVELTGLFDTYKICAIKVTYRPRFTEVDSAGEAGTGVIGFPNAYAHVIVDPDTNMSPSGVYNSATLNSFLENGNVKTYNLTKPFSVYFKPKALMALSGGSTGSAAVKAPWCRFSDTGVSHRGFHIFLQQNAFSNGANYIRLDTFVTYYMKAKYLR